MNIKPISLKKAINPPIPINNGHITIKRSHALLGFRFIKNRKKTIPIRVATIVPPAIGIFPLMSDARIDENA